MNSSDHSRDSLSKQEISSRETDRLNREIEERAYLKYISAGTMEEPDVHHWIAAQEEVMKEAGQAGGGSNPLTGR